MGNIRYACSGADITPRLPSPAGCMNPDNVLTAHRPPGAHLIHARVLAEHVGGLGVAVVHLEHAAGGRGGRHYEMWPNCTRT